MSLYRLLWFGATVLLGGLFLWENHTLLGAHLPVALRLPLLEIRPLPPDGPSVMLMLVTSFAAGAGVMYAVGLPKRVRTAMELRKLRRGGTAAQPSAVSPTGMAVHDSPRDHGHDAG